MRASIRSRSCVVLAGDARLIEKLRRDELIPLGSRIRTRLATEHASRDELLACLNHLTAGAGNAALMPPTAQHVVRSRRRQLPHPDDAGRRASRRGGPA